MKLSVVEVIPLIQIKQTQTGIRTVRDSSTGGSIRDRGENMNEQLNPMAPHHLPFYLAPESGTDVLMVVMGILLVVIVLWVGTLYWRLHSLPERMAHKSQKLQFEIVAILGLLALFTHIHLFWVAGLLLALIDLPDFGTPLRSIADSVEKIADVTPGEGSEAAPEAKSAQVGGRASSPPTGKPGPASEREHANV
jgi:hypothetical protein